MLASGRSIGVVRLESLRWLAGLGAPVTVRGRAMADGGVTHASRSRARVREGREVGVGRLGLWEVGKDETQEVVVATDPIASIT